MKSTVILAGCCCVSAWFLGCTASTPSGGSLYERLQDENPAVRIEACVEAAETGNRQALPLLMDRLNDSQSDVRFFAGQALERMLGPERWRSFGWVSWTPEDERARAVKKLRAWLRRQRADQAGPDSAPAGEPR